MEFKHFHKNTEPLHKQPRWLTRDALTGSSHIWHDLYLLAYTEVLGFVACRTTSKPLGIGACERSWGDVKHIKTGKRSYMVEESTKKRAVLYTTANIHKARIRRNIMVKIDAVGPNAMFVDDEIL